MATIVKPKASAINDLKAETLYIRSMQAERWRRGRPSPKLSGHLLKNSVLKT